MPFPAGKYRFARQRPAPNSSTCVAGLTFNLLEASLEVTFVRDGTTYEYSDLPVEVYAAFKRAGSRGQFFNDQIKGNYAYTRIG